MSRFSFLTLAALALPFAGLFAEPARALPPVAPQSYAAPLLSEVGHGGHIVRDFHYRGHNRGHNHYRGHRGWPYAYYPRRYYGFNPYWGRRCYGWNGYNCGYGRPYFGFGTGIVVVPRRYGYGYGNRHVRWCQNRYRSYNVRTNTWVAYSGRVRECISPYSR